MSLWPGCSLIYNSNIKCIVSGFSREAVANLIKSTLSLGRENCYKPQTIQRCPGQRVGNCPHSTLHMRVCISLRCFDILISKGVRLKCWSYCADEPGVSSPFNTRLLLTFKPFQKLWYLWQEDRWVRRTSQGQLRWSARDAGEGNYFTFQIRHTPGQLNFSRPCLLCRKPHFKHGLVCGREVA